MKSTRDAGGSILRELKPYPKMKDSGIEWLGEVPAHWGIERGKWLFSKMDRPVREADEVVTCFRDGVVTLRKNRRVRGFTESLQEIGYQGIRRGDLVVHGMDAFAGAIGVADSDGKGTPVYSVCEPGPTARAEYYALTFARDGTKPVDSGAHERDSRTVKLTFVSKTSVHRRFRIHPCPSRQPSSASSTTPTDASGATSAPKKS